MVIKVSRKEIDKWNAYDFVKFFVSRFYNNYPGTEYSVNYAKEGMIFKRIVSKFRKNGQSKESVKHFVDWVFSEYLKRSDFTEPLTIGFLPSWTDEYLNVTPETQVKKRRKEPQLSSEMEEWLKEERKRYKPNYVKRSG